MLILRQSAVPITAVIRKYVCADMYYISQTRYHMGGGRPQVLTSEVF
jgi:hypothetical protein